jgi:hypothetical protein
MLDNHWRACIAFKLRMPASVFLAMQVQVWKGAECSREFAASPKDEKLWLSTLFPDPSQR